jgi:hypothetical protein
MSAHGGVRRGAGRPRLRSADRRQVINFTLSPKTLKAFRNAVPEGERARYVERAILFKLEYDQRFFDPLDLQD